MNGAVKLAGFAAVLAAAFGIGFGVGEVAGPFGTGTTEPAEQHDMPTTVDQR